jgi:hypothetical protein
LEVKFTPIERRKVIVSPQATSSRTLIYRTLPFSTLAYAKREEKTEIKIDLIEKCQFKMNDTIFPLRITDFSQHVKIEFFTMCYSPL